ncbi:DUF3231 family protein [Neobacillus sp. LXY-4]|uniref:DUF3231 family protein n=1 Tax=Neobacillus sp. LXY-4 TaxID=3379826 RepID=UPI003EDEC692
MENIDHNNRLSSGEIANLWSQYMSDTMSICVLKHSIEVAQDKDIKEILIFALNIAESQIIKIKDFLRHENYPIPEGFTSKDVNLTAPPLFTDTFMLVYIYVMTLLGMTGYAGAVSTSIRADQMSYFIHCNKQAMELFERTVTLMLQKGIYSRPPKINPPSQIDFVHNQSYLTGWFGKKRPLNAVEISGICYNIQKTIAKVVLELGFAQVCQTKELQEYFNRGKNICKRQVGTLSTILTNEDLISPPSWVSEVTNSTIPPFSDKLMLFHIVQIISAAIGFYSAALSVSQRRDLVLTYTALIAEIGLYAEDGIQLLIKNGWMEQPPLAENRDRLANEKF